MLAATGLLILSTLGPAELGGALTSATHVQPLRVAGAPLARGTAPADMALRSPLLEADEALARRFRTLRLAQTATPSGGQGGATTAPAGSAAAPAGGGDQAAPAAAPEEEEPDISLMRQRASIIRTHRPLGIATVISLAVTELLGTISVIDQRTVFGDGQCIGGSGVFGDFSCNGGLTNLHLLSSFVTTSLYTATGIFALSMPDPEHAMQGNDRRGSSLRVHRALAWGHLTGMILMPILGIIAANPNLIGITVHGTTPAQIAASAQDVQNFQADMRTIHMFVGYATLAMLTTAMVFEL